MDDKNFNGSDNNFGGGFLGGDSFDSYSSNNDNSFGQSNNSFGGNDNRFGQSNNSFGSNNNFGQNNNSFGSNNNFGQSNNSFGSNNNFGQSNNSFGSNNNFGGGSINNAPQDNYDPNAMFSDPSSNLYGGSSSDSGFSSFNSAPRVNTVTLPQNNNKNKIVAAAVILIAIAVGIAVVFYIMNSGKKTFRQWSETAEGRSFISSMESTAKSKYGNADYDIDIEVRDDDKLVLKLTLKEYEEFTPEAIEFMKVYTEEAMKSQSKSLAQSMKKICSNYKVEDFQIVYDMRNADDSPLYEYVVKTSDA